MDPVAISVSLLALTVGLSALVVAVRATPARLLSSLRRAQQEGELVADRLEALESRFEGHKLSTLEHVEAMEGLADRITRERKRKSARDKADDRANAEPQDYLAELRQRARAQGLEV